MKLDKLIDALWAIKKKASGDRNPEVKILLSIRIDAEENLHTEALHVRGALVLESDQNGEVVFIADSRCESELKKFLGDLAENPLETEKHEGDPKTWRN